MLRAQWSLVCLYCRSHTFMAVFAYLIDWNHSAFKISWRIVPFRLSLYPFSQGLPG